MLLDTAASLLKELIWEMAALGWDVTGPKGFKEQVLDAWGDMGTKHSPSPKEVRGILGADFPGGHPKPLAPCS